jgi:hypothetical protein
VDRRLELCNPDPHNCRATFLASAFQSPAGMIHDAEDDKSHAVRHHEVTDARVRCTVTPAAGIGVRARDTVEASLATNFRGFIA